MLLVLETLCLLADRRRDWPVLLDRSTKRLEIARTLQRRPDQAQAWFMIGDAHMGLQRPTEAEAAYSSAIELFAALGDPVNRAFVLESLAQLHDGHDNPRKALEELRQAATLFEAENDAEALASVRKRIADLECRLPRPPPPPSPHPPDTREYYYERIVFQHLRDADAGALLEFITQQARAAGPAPAGAAEADDNRTRIDFKEAACEINDRGDASQRVVLGLLVEGSLEKAALAFEKVVGAAGDRTRLALWMKGALFVTVAPAVSRYAWERLLAMWPDFHYCRCAYGRLLARLGDSGAAESAFREVLARVDGDPAMQAAATDWLGNLARQRGDSASEWSYMERSLRLYRKAGDAQGERMSLAVLGQAAERRGEHMVAEPYYQRSLLLSEQANDAKLTQPLLETLARIAVRRGDEAAAAGLRARRERLA
jgi:tetratricopeptide (TPR) repeat protein